MNRVLARVSKVLSDGYLSVVFVDSKVGSLSLLLLEKDDYLREGREITLLFSPSSVKLFRELPKKTSIENILKGQIIKITSGSIISTVSLKCETVLIEAYLSSICLSQMNLKEGEEIYLGLSAFDVMVEV